MKTAVFIVGTNCTGKTTAAKKIIELCGGVDCFKNNLTKTKKGLYLAGKYDRVKYGGVDWLTKTSILFDMCKNLSGENVLFEGVKLHGVGSSLQSAERMFVVFLYAPAHVLSKRIKQRSNGTLTIYILKDQRFCAKSVVKWRTLEYKHTPLIHQKLTAKQ